MDFGGNGSTPIAWGPCYCVVIVLLLSCYAVVIVLLLLCYAAVIVLLLCCYCRATLAVVVVLLCCSVVVVVVLLYPPRCIVHSKPMCSAPSGFCGLSARTQARLARTHGKLLAAISRAARRMGN